MGGVEERFSRVCALSRHVKYNLQEIFIELENQKKHTAVALLENEVVLASGASYNITSETVAGNVVGRCFSGEFITQIKSGSLSRLSDEDNSPVLSVVFSTASGAVGLIASMPSYVYQYLMGIETKMKEAREALGGFIGFRPRNCLGVDDEFIDGDFLESYLTLDTQEQIDIAVEMGYPVETLKVVFEHLSLFH